MTSPVQVTDCSTNREVCDLLKADARAALALLRTAALQPVRTWTDADGGFSLTLARR